MVAQKLEKQLTSLKKQQYLLSTDSHPWAVKENPALGEFFVVMVGAPNASANVQHMVLHKLIGIDYKIDPEHDWILSNAADIPSYLSQRDNPSEEKAMEKLRHCQGAIAIKSGMVTITGGEEYYPNGQNRKDVLNLAREASAIHAKVKGGNHFGEWMLYLSPDNVKHEMGYQAAFRNNPDYGKEKLVILDDMIKFKTELVDGRRQQAVPYLKGLSAKEVLKHFYGAMIGKQRPIPEGFVKNMAKILPVKLYSKYLPGDETMRETLVRELTNFREASKAFNIAKTALSQAKVKKDERELQRIVDHEAETLADARAKVLSVETSGQYPEIKITKAYEIEADPDKL
jgi:hypothetical protein